jgi:hypothetical protein
MSSPRAHAGRSSGPRRPLVLVASAAVGLAVLLGGLALPLLGLALAEETAGFCGGKGRCCCAGDTAARTDDRPCVRRSCGCERPEATVAGAPLTIEAVLPATGEPARPEPRSLDGTTAARSLHDRPHAPPVPPPRPRLPA